MTAVRDWLIAAAISAAIIYSLGLILGIATGFFPEAFGASAFMVFIGYAGIPISLASSAYAPELVPIFIGLVAFWGVAFWFMRRFHIQRLVGIAISTVCLLSLWGFGMLGIIATQVV